jgi:gamma-glutamyltranspeptidase
MNFFSLSGNCSILSYPTLDLYANHSIPATSRPGTIDDLTFYHHLIEAQKFAYAQRTLLGDAAFVPEALALAKNMTTREYTKWIVSRMPKEAQPSAYYGGIAAQVWAIP